MRAAHGLRTLLLLCALLPALAVPHAAAKERLLWLVRDLPPFTIFEGTEKGQGVIDRLLPLLIEQMPEYDHSIVRVNRARGIQMLQDPNTFTCDPTLLWTPERAEYVHFSIPSLGVLSGGLVVRKAGEALLAPFLTDNEVDLPGLMSHTPLKLGIVAERSYGTQIDEILRQLPGSALSRHYGNDATANQLQMQQLGRLHMVMGYWPEVRYLIQQQGGSLGDYQFHPVRGVNRYQFLHVGCSDSALGREAVAHIDQLLPTLRQETLPGLYARWLDPELQATYLEQSKQFFKQP
ncbi:TIGR02285 family protein [Pseudomonas kermanshahensis]|uniref:TIGR02285 family protein n=1 Tax=Pseudomonas kermanshahensis TaxID=2745482 RepID=A0ABU8R2L9_9PSED|nr:MULTISPECIES: TIGR02285 family protein [Pseudomonas]MBC3484292.1 TIGR02285 family protein [Pseudomonas sp. SWRI50]MBC3495926.1 TIGR02285 family protein [Pseudomonas sp. SWRI67]MBV4525176.1 TIGR02285 family protein [Pseudomonas kermanshahensis]